MFMANSKNMSLTFSLKELRPRFPLKPILLSLIIFQKCRMKNNIEYYCHYANSHNHPKFKLLRLKYGWAGEGRFWALNNIIAGSDNCILNLNKKYVAASVSSDLGMSIEEFQEFISYLVKDCELLVDIDGNVTTENVRETFKEVMKQRVRNKENREKAILSKNELKLIRQT